MDEPDDPPLTGTQLAYLTLFDRRCRAHRATDPDSEQASTDKGMGMLLELMFEDAAQGLVGADLVRREQGRLLAERWGAFGRHLRWHVNRNHPNLDCPFCTTSPQRRQPMKELHPATEAILKFFDYEHLPAHLQVVSQPFHDLAWDMAGRFDGAELTTGLRKLLEAKDCMVRAAL